MFLDRSAIEQSAPSVYATEHDGERSDSYVFVSSERIIEGFQEIGWGVTHAQQPNSRKSNPLHNKHILRFRPQDEGFSFSDPRSPGKLVHPEVALFNSSNGTCRVRLLAGAFSMICSNGLIIVVPGFEELMEDYSRKHQNFDPEVIYQAAAAMTEGFGGFFTNVSEMVQLDLMPPSLLKFAQLAKDLRFPDADFDPMALLKPRRKEDVGIDLWTVTNVIQENCIRGGFKLASRTARALTNIDATQKVNQGIWDIAESFMVN